jgi:platelet-activating factor acetylhydrolase IB subunit alpha
MVLADSDRNALHGAIVEYLEARGCGPLAAEVKKHLQDARGDTDATQLEKRWKTLQRLTNRNLELEGICKKLEQDLRDLQNPHAVKVKGKDALPAEPSLHVFRGHREPLSSVVIHPIEPIIFTASEDGSIRMWDLNSRNLLQTSTDHTDSVTALALEPVEHRVLASAGLDHTVKLYDAMTLECTRTLYGHEAVVNCLCWVGDSQKTLISGGRDGVRVWDTQRAAIKQGFAKDFWVRSLTVPQQSGGPSANGQGPSSSSAAGGSTSTGTFSAVVALAGGDGPGGIQVWNWSTAQQQYSIPDLHSNAVEAVCYSNFECDSAIIAAHGSPDMKESLKILERSIRVAQETAGSPDAGAAAAADIMSKYEPQFLFSAGRDKVIVISRITTRQAFLTLSVHDNWVRQLALSGNGKNLISCSDDGKLIVTDLSTKRIVRKINAHDHFVTCFGIHTGAKPLAVTGSADKTLKLWSCN